MTHFGIFAIHIKKLRLGRRTCDISAIPLMFILLSWRTAHFIGMAYNTKTCSVRCRRNDTFTDVTKSVESFGLVDSLL